MMTPSLLPLQPQFLDEDQVNSYFRGATRCIVHFVGSLLPSSAGFLRLLWHREILYYTKGLVSVLKLQEVVE